MATYSHRAPLDRLHPPVDSIDTSGKPVENRTPHRHIPHLADEVEDSDHDAPDLVEKLRSASFADLVATVEKLGF